MPPQLTGQQVVNVEGRVVIVPLPTKPLARGTLASIMRQAGLRAEDLQGLL